MFIDLAARLDVSNGIVGNLIGARRGTSRIAVEIKDFRGKSAIADLEQAIGQYVLYRLLLEQIDPERELYLAVAQTIFDGIFSEPIGELVMRELPMKLLTLDVDAVEVKRWIPPRESGTL